MHRGAKTVAVLAALVVLVLATTGLSSAKEEKNALPRGCSMMFTVQDFRPFSADVWRLSAWERGAPPKRVVLAQRERLKCSTPAHREAMQNTWRADKKAFYEHRDVMLWRAKYRQFEYPDGTRWAVPYPIAWCESGGDYYVGPSGAYGLIPPFPQWLSPKRQDEIAYELYLELGESPWAPYESTCAYR